VLPAQRAVFLPRNAKIRPRTGFLMENAYFFSLQIPALIYIFFISPGTPKYEITNK
jgi:hypothetical protein